MILAFPHRLYNHTATTPSAVNGLNVETAGRRWLPDVEKILLKRASGRAAPRHWWTREAARPSSVITHAALCASAAPCVAYDSVEMEKNARNEPSRTFYKIVNGFSENVLQIAVSFYGLQIVAENSVVERRIRCLQRLFMWKWGTFNIRHISYVVQEYITVYHVGLKAIYSDLQKLNWHQFNYTFIITTTIGLSILKFSHNIFL